MSGNLLSICVVTHNNEDMILTLLRSIYENTIGLKFEMFLVDNASKDFTVDIVKESYPKVKIIRLKKNKGFSYANNQVIDKIDSEYHVIINPDITFDTNVFKALSDYLAQNDEVAIVTPKIISADKSVQYLGKLSPRFVYLLAGRLKNRFRFFERYYEDYVMKDKTDKSVEPFEVEVCTGCFMVIRTEIFKRLRGFDERFFMYFEDVDLSRRARSFGKIIFYPNAQVTHIWARASAKKVRFLLIHILSMIKYFFKWRKF